MTLTHPDTQPSGVDAGLPETDADPFGPDILEDPGEFHTALRDAGPLVHLTRYDVYAMGRYEEVHAALTDWQSFQSGAGVGLSNFRFEKPWRPPSLLLESDPPVHDAPRSVLSSILSPVRCADCVSTGSPTPRISSTRCPTANSTRSPTSHRSSRCASFPTRSASASTAARICCPTGTICSTRSGRRTNSYRRDFHGSARSRRG